MSNAFTGKPGKKARVNLRIDSTLIEWVKLFAKARNTTVTSLIVGGLIELRRKYGGAPPKVDQV